MVVYLIKERQWIDKWISIKIKNVMDFSSLKTIDGSLYSDLLRAGFAALQTQEKYINALNVFPVPDGDTGTNMLFTMQNGIATMKSSPSLSDVASSFAEGALFGAHGNSGVLLSLYFQGIATSLKGKETASVLEFATALKQGYETSYRGALKPVEGTILTVEREGIDQTLSSLTQETTLGQFFTVLVKASHLSLENTPNLLDVLKEAGVIDSGGQGLLTIFEGMAKRLNGNALDPSIEISSIKMANDSSFPFANFNENSSLDYGYCLEFFLQLLSQKIDITSFSLPDFISWLSQHGNSLVCYQNGTLVKVHIHTHHPGEVITYAQRFGEFVSFKMDNMTLQAHEAKIKQTKKQQKRKSFGILSVAEGQGLRSLFTELGSSLVLDGGESISLSTRSFLDAFEEINADTILVLPNDGNIALVASQAAKLETHRQICLLPSYSMQQGYFALAMTSGLEEQSLAETMEAEIKKVSSYFVAEASKNGLHYSQGDFVGGQDKQIWVSGEDLNQVALALFERIPHLEDNEVVVVFTGEGVTKEDQNALKESFMERYPSLEIGFVPGGQAHYSYWIGVYQ